MELNAKTRALLAEISLFKKTRASETVLRTLREHDLIEYEIGSRRDDAGAAKVKLTPRGEQVFARGHSL